LAALAGVILHVALLGMVERDIPAWLQRRRTRIDGLTAVLVTLVTVVYDLMIAVAVGLVLAVLQFVREQIQAPVVHRRFTAADHSSLCRRPEEDRRLLEEHGHQIAVYELRGHLFFGTVDRLFDELAPDLQEDRWVILDMGRIAGVDLTAVRVLQQMASTLAARGGRLIFATVRKGRGLGRKVRKTFRKISPHHASVPVDTYVDIDEALEEAENELLASLGRPAQDPERSVELTEVDLCRELPPEDLEVLKRHLEWCDLRADQKLFELDSPGEEIYMILSGEVDAVLRYSKHHHLRVGKFGPGTLLGEVSFIDPGPRTAEARVIRDGKAAILRRSAFDRIRQESPETAVRLVLALGRELADHLRSANASVGRLADQ
jgi:SulP family sulfate permease